MFKKLFNDDVYYKLSFVCDILLTFLTKCINLYLINAKVLYDDNFNAHIKYVFFQTICNS